MASRIYSAYELYVSRLPWFISSKELRDYFSQFGTVKRCSVPFEKETGFHKGYGWVGFTSEQGLSNALKKKSHILEGTEISIRKQQLNLSRQEAISEREELQETFTNM